MLELTKIDAPETPLHQTKQSTFRDNTDELRYSQVVEIGLVAGRSRVRLW